MLAPPTFFAVAEYHRRPSAIWRGGRSANSFAADGTWRGRTARERQPEERTAMRKVPLSFSPEGLASARSRHAAGCVTDNINDDRWSGNDGRVIEGMRRYLRLHALSHVALRLRDDHSILFGHQKPARNVLPQRAADRNGDAAQRYRPLHGSQALRLRPSSPTCCG